MGTWALPGGHWELEVKPEHVLRWCHGADDGDGGGGGDDAEHKT